MRAVENWAEVGERVRAARVALDLTQADLARRIGLDRTALVRVETGDRHISALELARLAGVLEIPVAHFLTRSPGPLAAYRAAVSDAPIGGSDMASDRLRFLLDVELENHCHDAEWLLQRDLLTASPVLRESGVADPEDARALARLARARLGTDTGPIGSMLSAAEKFGLYVKVVPRSTTGASLQIAPGFGVAVVGAESDPGRRRSTAAHELGHHLFGDTYNSDAGVAAGEDEREGLVDVFVSEFLLPHDVLDALHGTADETALRPALVGIAGEYRVSWSVAVHAAERAGLLDATASRRLAASTPGKGDFMAVLGAEPRADLGENSTGPQWRKAILAAWKGRLVTAGRAVALLNGALTVDELPDPDGPVPE